MDGMSLEQLVEVLDKNLSPAVVAKRQVRHSTPESVIAKRHITPESAHVELKLVGKEVKTHVRAGGKANYKLGTITTAGKKMRNYSRK